MYGSSGIQKTQKMSRALTFAFVVFCVLALLIVSVAAVNMDGPGNVEGMREGGVLPDDADKKLSQTEGDGTVPIARPRYAIGGMKPGEKCLSSGGYTWCEFKQKCVRTWEEDCPQ